MQSYSNNHQDYSADNDFAYGRRSTEQRTARPRRSQQSRSRASTSGFGGLHRRRNKHWSW
jgi:hypothetical protein